MTHPLPIFVTSYPTTGMRYSNDNILLPTIHTQLSPSFIQISTQMLL